MCRFFLHQSIPASFSSRTLSSFSMLLYTYMVWLLLLIKIVYENAGKIFHSSLNRISFFFFSVQTSNHNYNLHSPDTNLIIIRFHPVDRYRCFSITHKPPPYFPALFFPISLRAKKPSKLSLQINLTFHYSHINGASTGASLS